MARPSTVTLGLPVAIPVETRLSLSTLKVAQSSFLIFFNTNSLRDRCYHTVSFVSIKIISNKCPFIVQQVLIIFIP